MNHWWGFDLVHQWMTTGKFEWKLPFVGTWIKYQVRRGRAATWWRRDNCMLPALLLPFRACCSQCCYLLGHVASNVVTI